MSKLTFSIPGRPKGKGRPRFANGRVYTPGTTAQYEREIRRTAKREMAEQGWIKPHREKGVTLLVNARFAIPKSERKKHIPSDPYLHKPDADNILKVAADALNGLAFEDDAQIHTMAAHKEYAERPALIITIITEGESNDHTGD